MDYYFIFGLVLAILCVPAIISAYSENRTPRFSAIMVVIAGGLMAYAASNKPGGYELGEIPELFVTVVGQIIR
nr:hypothetical protein [Nereida sp. MMG025]